MKAKSKMKLQLLIFLSFLVIVNRAICQDAQPAKQNRILKNWAAVQVGELAGWGVTALTLKLLEGMDVINSNSGDQRDEIYIATAITAGHLAGNLLLKKQARQSTGIFLKNLAFSALPVITYTVLASPNFEKTFPAREIQKDIGLVLVSMFVTPVFSAIGNEIFNKKEPTEKPSFGKEMEKIRIQPYLTTLNHNSRIGVMLSF